MPLIDASCSSRQCLRLHLDDRLIAVSATRPALKYRSVSSGVEDTSPPPDDTSTGVTRLRARERPYPEVGYSRRTRERVLP